MTFKHSSQSNEWYTPSHIMDMVREVLGSIDFDPSSCFEANKIIQAKSFYNWSSLERPWLKGSIYCNPPGGKIKGKSQAVLFWDKLMEHYLDCQDFKHAIFMGFSLSLLRTTQLSQYPSALSFPFCIPSERIHFIGAGNSPQYDNVIIYVPGYEDNRLHFVDTFSTLGKVIW